MSCQVTSPNFASHCVVSRRVSSRHVKLRPIKSPLRHVKSRHLTPRHVVTSRHASHITPRHVTSRSVALRCVSSHYVTSRRVTSSLIASRHFSSCHAMPFHDNNHVTLCCFMSSWSDAFSKQFWNCSYLKLWTLNSARLSTHSTNSDVKINPGSKWFRFSKISHLFLIVIWKGEHK